MKILKWLIPCLLLSLGVYILSILWRVSVAEQQNFGRSDLIPLSLNRPQYHLSRIPHLAPAYGSGMYVFERQGRRIWVWRQEINGFQHIYGSALAAYELGSPASSLLFCGNEYMEAIADLVFDHRGIQLSDLRDRRKDLYHNDMGRRVGEEARKQRLWGRDADLYIQRRILSLMDQGLYISHYKNAWVDALPSEADMGCPGLPPAGALYKTGR